MGDEDGDPTTSNAGRRSKVERLIDEYQLTGLGDELERHWTSESERRSLRDLAQYFNEQLLASAMAEAGMSTLDGEVENIYRLLTDSDVSEGVRTQAARRLEREGVDVEALQDDFVSYQAIRTYLKKYRGAEYTPTEGNQVEREAENVQKLLSRTEAIAQGKLEQLRSTNRIELGDFRVSASLHVFCSDCGRRYSIDELLDRGGCDCTDADENRQ